MASRRPLHRAAVATALLAAGGAAAVLVGGGGPPVDGGRGPGPVRRVPAPGAPPPARPLPQEGPPLASSPPDGAEGRGTGNDSLPAGPSAGPVPGEDPLGDPPPLPDVVVFHDGGTRAVLPPDALPAVPAFDPATGGTVAVEPGRPPTVAIADFVADPAAAAKAVELVGDRRPALEEGVPVSLSGRVLAAEDGAPVAGATVVLSSTFYVRTHLYDHHLREVAHATTDADGVFTVERLNAEPAHFGRGGLLHLTATAPGRAPALAVPLSGVSPGVAHRVADLRLAAAPLSLAGRVLDEWEGRPVAGARVYATGAVDPIAYPKDQRAALFLGAPAATTDAEGRFLLEGLGRGVQVISAHGGDDCLGSERLLLPRTGEAVLRTRGIRGRIEGTTVDGEGSPVPLVAVMGGGNTTHSFADGRWVLENFPGDEVDIRFSHPDFPAVVVAGVADGTTGLLVRMEAPLPAVILEVSDRDTGAPVPRVRVEFLLDGGGPAGDGTSPERVSPAGRHEVRLPAGAAALRISAEGRSAAEVPLAGRIDGEVVPVLLAPAGE